MDVTDGAAASAPHVLMDAVGPMKRRRPVQTSGELSRVEQGGYDATFQRSGGPDAKHMCFMCKKVLRQPLQTRCGHRFCASCIRPALGGGEVVCPELDCNNVLTPGDLFSDTFAEREILNLDVVCSAVTAHCPWNGKLRNLEDHQAKCAYISVVCGQNGCPDLIARGSLTEHQQTDCRYRFVNCPHCSSPIVFHTMTEHQHECQEWPTECPQRCGETHIPRRLVSEHVANGCMLTVAPCRFAFVDCTFKGNREEMEAHVVNSASAHLVQLASICALQQRQLSERSREITALQTQLTDVVDHLQSSSASSSALTSSSPSTTAKSGGVRGLSSLLSRQSTPSSPPMQRSKSAAGDHTLLQHALDRIDYLEKQVSSLQSAQSRNGILVWRIDNFIQRQRIATSGSARHVTSDPFYTSPHGYKLCARAYLNGDGIGQGQHLSVYVIIMKGEYDMVLHWPFAARVTLSLLDQGGSRKHHHEKFFPDDRSSSFARPVGEMNVASGCPQFIRLSALERFGYIQDDSIVIRVAVDTSGIQGVDSNNFL